MNTTNVRPSYLNYDRYTMTKYERDIVGAVPFYWEIHKKIKQSVWRLFKNRKKECRVLDLGAGTGVTSAVVREVLPSAHFDIVDFSRQMLAGAKRKLGKKNMRYFLKDYSTFKLDRTYDLIISVIGIHHQTHAGKKKMFKKIYRRLKPGGVFIFGDLVTYRDKKRAALNTALHYHHMVEKASSQKMLAEWAHHHHFLNDLAPIEDQIIWLKEAGFSVCILFLKMNTAFLICYKRRVK